MRDLLLKIHNKITNTMADMWIVENVLIAKVKEDGETYDCIYCTILRNAVIFVIIGLILGYFIGCSYPLPA